MNGVNEAGLKNSGSSFWEKLRTIPTWIIVILLVFLFPVGLYTLWKQNRWTKRTKHITTWLSSAALVVFFTLAVIFVPPTVTVTSSLEPVKGDSYQLTGKIYPADSRVTVNGKQATVTGDTFTSTVSLTEGDNSLKVVVISGNKRTEQIFNIHRYTKNEIAAQEAAAAKKKAEEVAAAEAKTKQEADAKAKAEADAAAKAAAAKAAAEAAAKQKALDEATVSQKNALSKAKDYLRYTAFSHDGLVDQLVYEQFSLADATYGADNCGADWNEQAAKKAKEYMSYSSFSRGSLIDQLEYEKFTPSQAAHGADSVGL